MFDVVYVRTLRLHGAFDDGNLFILYLSRQRQYYSTIIIRTFITTTITVDPWQRVTFSERFSITYTWPLAADPSRPF